MALTAAVTGPINELRVELMREVGMALSKEQRDIFEQHLKDLKAAMKNDGPEALQPNADGGLSRRDDDHQPLNEMLQAIASGRNRNRGLILGLVDAALERLAEEPEEYGLCMECEETIPVRRLELMPYAPLCVRCQTEIENENASTRSGGRRSLRDYI